MIFFVRKLTKNFLEKFKDSSINGMPIVNAPLVDEINAADPWDYYLNEILMKMETDAQGLLLVIVPIALRLNVWIVNVDLSERAKRGEVIKFGIMKY